MMLIAKKNCKVNPQIHNQSEVNKHKQKDEEIFFLKKEKKQKT